MIIRAYSEWKTSQISKLQQNVRQLPKFTIEIKVSCIIKRALTQQIHFKALINIKQLQNKTIFKSLKKNIVFIQKVFLKSVSHSIGYELNFVFNSKYLSNK